MNQPTLFDTSPIIVSPDVIKESWEEIEESMRIDLPPGQHESFPALFNERCRRAYYYMKDGKWHDGLDIAFFIMNGHRATDPLRSLRQLRKIPMLKLDKRLIPGTTGYSYRLRYKHQGEE